MSTQLLHVYLNDHYAGSTFGAQLARRAAGENRGTETGAVLDRLAREIVEDQRSLERIMEALGVRRNAAKVALAWLVEKAARVKPNGQLRGYSPLSRVLELEGLQGGIRAKLSLWIALEAIAPSHPRLDEAQLTTLVERAERQLDELRPVLRAAAAEAFAGG